MDFSLVRACLTILLELPEYAAVFDCGVTQLKDLWVVVDVGEGVAVGAGAGGGGGKQTAQSQETNYG